MSLTKAQIRPGTVAYLSTNTLRDHQEIEASKPVFPKEDKTICHVCYEVVGDVSYWAPLTKSTPHAPITRLDLVRAWRLRGKAQDAWNADPMYLRDGAMTYRGPSLAFVLAASGEFTMNPCERPLVSAAGVEAIREEIEDKGGFMLEASKDCA